MLIGVNNIRETISDLERTISNLNKIIDAKERALKEKYSKSGLSEKLSPDMKSYLEEKQKETIEPEPLNSPKIEKSAIIMQEILKYADPEIIKEIEKDVLPINGMRRDIDKLREAILLKQESEVTSMNSGLESAKLVVAEDNIEAVFTNGQKGERGNELKKAFDHAFSLVKGKDIETLAVKALENIVKVHYNKKYSKAGNSQKKRKSFLEKYFDITYENKSGIVFSGNPLMKSVTLKNGIRLNDIFEIPTKLHTLEHRPTELGTHIETLRNSYHNKIHRDQIGELKKQVSDARAIIKKEGEKIKEAENLLKSTIVTNALFGTGAILQGHTIDELNECIKAIKKYEIKIQEISNKVGNTTVAQTQADIIKNTEELTKLNGMLQEKFSKINSFAEAASTYFLNRLGTCNQRSTALNEKIINKDKPVDNMLAEVEGLNLNLESLRTANTEAIKKINEKRESIIQTLKKEQEAISSKQKDLTEKKAELVNENKNMQNLEEMRSKLKDSLTKLEQTVREEELKGYPRETKIEEISKINDHLDEADAEVEKLQKSIDVLKNDITTLESTLKEDNDKLVESTNQALNEYDEEKNKEANNVGREITVLEIKIGELKKKIDSKKEKISEKQEKHLNELGKLKEEIQNLSDLLTTITNLPSDSGQKVKNLQDAETTMVEETKKIEAEETQSIAKIEEDVNGVTSGIKSVQILQDVPSAAEVRSAIDKLKSETEATINQVDRIKENSEALIGITSTIASHHKDDFDKIRFYAQESEKFANSASEHLKIMKKRNDEMLERSITIGKNLATLLKNIIEIKKLNSQADTLLTRIAFRDLEPKDIIEVQALLQVLKHLTKEEEKLKNGKGNKNKLNSTKQKKEKIGSLISDILGAETASQRKELYKQAQEALLIRRTNYRIPFIGSIIRKALQGKETQSVRIYNDAKRHQATIAPNNDYQENLLTFTREADPSSVEKADKAKVEYINVCNNMIEDIGRRKAEIDKMMQEIENFRQPEGTVEGKDGKEVNEFFNKQIGELQSIKLSLENIGERFGTLKKKIEEAQYYLFMFRCSDFNKEYKGITSSLTEVSEKIPQITQDIDSFLLKIGTSIPTELEASPAIPKQEKPQPVVTQEIKEKVDDINVANVLFGPQVAPTYQLIENNAATMSPNQLPVANTANVDLSGKNEGENERTVDLSVKTEETATNVPKTIKQL